MDFCVITNTTLCKGVYGMLLRIKLYIVTSLMALTFVSMVFAADNSDIKVGVNRKDLQIDVKPLLYFHGLHIQKSDL